MKRPTWWATPISTRRYVVSMVAVAVGALAAIWLGSIWRDGPIRWDLALWGAFGAAFALTSRWFNRETGSTRPPEAESEHPTE